MKKLFFFVITFVLMLFTGNVYAADDSNMWNYEICDDGVILTQYLGTQTDIYVPNKITAEGIEYSVIKVGENLLGENKNSVNSVTFDEGITEIGAGAFEGAENLVCIVTAESLVTIGENAFSNCTNFNSIILYDTVTTIGANAFEGCSKLAIYCNENNAGYEYAIQNNIPYILLSATSPTKETIDGITYYVLSGKALVEICDTSVTEANILPLVKGCPVTAIMDNAFENCTALTSVTIPNTVATIGDYAFSGCTALVSVTLPDSIKKISDYMFNECNALSDVSIPQDVTKIGKYAFYRTYALERIDIPDGVKEVEAYAFYESAISEVSIPKSLETIGDGAFNHCKIKVFDFPEGLKTIGKHALVSSVVEKVTIPDSVTSIGDYCMSSCSNLVSVDMGDGIEIIPQNCFRECVKLETIGNPRNISRIGIHAFYKCRSLKEFYFYDNIKYIEDGAFQVCENLKNLYINDLEAWCNVDFEEGDSYPINTSGRSNVYINGELVTDLVLPEGITTIKIRAWLQLYGAQIKSITIPKSVTSIDPSSFWEKTVLYVHENSYAHQYVKDNGKTYMLLDDGKIPEIVTQNNVNYYISNGRAIVYSYDNTITDIVVEEKVNGYPVTEIQTPFRGKSSLKSVTLPDTITEIPGYAFYGCSGLTSIKLPENITSIGPYAFSNCSNLTSIDIPANVTTIGDHAFYYCTSLETVSLHEGLTFIGLYGFYMCEKLENITLPDTLEILCGYSFGCCRALTSIKVPDGVPVINDETFYGCRSLTSVNLPEGLTLIGSRAFQWCSALTKIVIPEGVKSIHQDAFGSSALTEITIPSTLTEINNFAFRGCENITAVHVNDLASWCKITFKNSTANPFWMGNANLYFGEKIVTDLVIPDGVTTIGADAFRYCKGLSTVTIPESLTSVPSTFPSGILFFVHENSPALTSIKNNSYPYILISEGETPEVYSVDGITYNIKDSEAIVVYCNPEITEAVIPETVKGYTVTKIQGAFSGCENLVSVTMPDTITEIGEGSFSNCTKLENIVLSQSITKIKQNTFKGCTSLSKIDLPDSVTFIVHSAFEGCTSLLEINLNQVTGTGDTVFKDCSALTKIDIGAVTYFGKDVFNGCSSLSGVHVDTLDHWCSITFPNSGANPLSYGHNLYINGELLTEAEISKGRSYTFYGCTSLKKVTITTSMINAYAFSSSGVEEVILSEGVRYIEDGAFSSCKELKKISMPNGLKEIAQFAFSGCSALEEVDIPDSVTKLGAKAVSDDSYVFRWCSNLKSVKLPSGIKILGSHTFDSCTALESIVIPEGITTLCYRAFYNCTSLKSVSIPSTITTASWFEGCTALENLILAEGLTGIFGNQFRDSDKLFSVIIPKSVTSLATTSFSDKTVLVVYRDSYAHNFAVENNLMYFVIGETLNPEISYGEGITGTATYTDGTVAVGADVDILYDDGTVKETEKTNAAGEYSFKYAEVGRYTIRVTDTNGNTASEVVSVKRMNVFDVFLAGTTDLVLKKGYSISGTVSPENATITLTDTDSNVIDITQTTDGTFIFANMPNGTYILKAETENGTFVKEITVFNSDVTNVVLTVVSQSATITGCIEIEDREFNRYKRSWVKVTIFNADGVSVDSDKTDTDGTYTFTNLPLGEYSIVAETNEMRPDRDRHFDRSHKLTGYAYVNVTEAKIYDNIDIVLYEENNHTATISGKVTAQGESQDCEVILANVFKHEVAKCITGKDGKYVFKNITDGLYFITAITNSKGMGFAVVTVRNGEVYGNTDITVRKSDRVHEYEEKMWNEIPDCDTHEKALEHKDKIAEHKKFYDSLPEKEKKQFSKDYIKRLNKLAELIAKASYNKPDNVEIENAGTVISGDELSAEETVEFVLSVTETQAHEIPDDGLKTREDFMQQSIRDTADNKHIAKYYDISLMKNGKEITNVHKHTDTTGKLRITMEIPEEYRGHKHYSFVHMHNGEPTTLVDLDDNPNTVTFEVDRFSTFALAYSDVELTEGTQYSASITYDKDKGKILVSSTESGTLYIATYNNECLVSLEEYTITAGTNESEYSFNENQAAFVWDEKLTPLCEKFTIN